MKRFKFSLDPLLEVRKRKEDAVKLEVGAKNREMMKTVSEMQDIHTDLTNLQADEKERRARNPDVVAMRHSVAYRSKLKSDLMSKGNQLDVLRMEAAGIKKKLIAATKDRRAIEIIGEHRLETWKRDFQREEQNASDDVSQQGFLRKTRAAAARRAEE